MNNSVQAPTKPQDYDAYINSKTEESFIYFDGKWHSLKEWEQIKATGDRELYNQTIKS